MSVYKKLWLAVLILLTVIFSASFILTTLSARGYLEQQLTAKNADDARALANALTRQRDDQVQLEKTIAAQFDTGQYEMIELLEPAGNATIRRIDDRLPEGAPAWFAALFPIEVEPGAATVHRGDNDTATLQLQSHPRFAYDDLWHNSLTLAGVFLLSGLAAGFIGNMILRRVLAPLETVVAQAEAIGERRFITTPEPDTLEFRQLVHAMNNLSARVKTMLSQESKRLQKWQRESHVDEVTGLVNREPFLNALGAALQSDDANSSGSLIIIRITNLARLNQTYGRTAVDSMLSGMGRALNRLAMPNSGWSASRLNGSDFALLAPRDSGVHELGRQAQQAMQSVLEDHNMEAGVQLPGGATIFGPRDHLGELLNRTDGALVAAERERTSTVTVAYKGDIPIRPVREQIAHWREVLEKALRADAFSLGEYPVVNRAGRLMHFEAPVKLDWEGKSWSAGQFLPWVHRLQISGQLDRQVTSLALRQIDRTGQPVAVNLSVAAIADNSFTGWFEEQLNSHNAAASKLAIELPESAVFRHLENFKRLVTRLKTHGGQVGIEHVGHQLADLANVHDVGLDYLKVDAAFVRGVQGNTGNQALLRTLCTLGHAIGVSVIAEGVENEREWDALQELGFDGATGPGIVLREGR